MPDYVRSTKVAFAQVPEELLFNPALSSHAKTVYAILDRRVDNRDGSDTQGHPFPGQEWIAERMGVSVPTVSKAVAELRDAGWISVARRQHTSNLYTLHDRPQLSQAKVGNDSQLSQAKAQLSHAKVPTFTGESKREQGQPEQDNESKKDLSAPNASEASADLFGNETGARSARKKTQPVDRHMPSFLAAYPPVPHPSTDTAVRTALARVLKIQHIRTILASLDEWCEFWTASGREPKYIPSQRKWLDDKYWEQKPPAVIRRSTGGKPSYDDHVSDFIARNGLGFSGEAS